MDEGSRRLPELVHLGGLFLRQDLRVQRERRRARKFTLLLVFPGLKGVLKCLGHRTHHHTMQCSLERQAGAQQQTLLGQSLDNSQKRRDRVWFHTEEGK